MCRLTYNCDYINIIFLQGNGTSPYSTVNQFSEISADGWTLPTLRSNSCSEAENFYTDSTISREKFDRGAACVLDEHAVHIYHCFKRVYADILHRWQFLYKKTEVSTIIKIHRTEGSISSSIGGSCSISQEAVFKQKYRV